MDGLLRDRIAAALLPSADYCQQSMTRPCDECMEYARKKADAVIRELGLTRVNRSERVPIHRYVTEWENDEQLEPR